MRIVVTGAGGFLGRAIVDELRARGHVVAGLMRRADQCREAEDFAADFLDAPTYRAAFGNFRPDALIHCGWHGVAARERDKISQLKNVGAAGELVAAAADVGARIVIGLGTQAEYGLVERRVNEADATSPVTLYGVAKLAAGAALLRIARQRGIRGVWARIFGVYGPNETARSMLPWLARELVAGRAPGLTACTQVWDFLHVRDAARAICDLLDCEDAEGVFNVATGETPLLRDTVLCLRDLIAPEIEPVFGAAPFGPEQIMCLAGDASRLISVTGWRPRIVLAEGLRELAEEAYRAARQP